MLCGKCGTQVADTAAFCQSCGSWMDDGAARKEAPAQAPQPPKPNQAPQEPSPRSAAPRSAAPIPEAPRSAAPTAPASTAEEERPCVSCGKAIKKTAGICPFCGARQDAPKADPPGPNQKSKTAAILLLVFLGGLGAHRFYVGRIGSALIMLGLGILYWIFLATLLIVFCVPVAIALFAWLLVDLIRICANQFTDAKGNPLKKGS